MTLQSPALTLSFCPQTGKLVCVTARLTGWKIVERATLGLSWQLLVPAGEHLRNNPVLGEKQLLSAYEKTETSLRLIWENVQSERAGVLAIRVCVTITVQGEKIVWETEIQNNSPYVVESVQSPYLGDVRPPDKTSRRLECFYAGYCTGKTNRLSPTFDDNCGYWGTDYATNYIKGVPEAPYVLLHDGTQGLFCGVHEDSCEVLAWKSEMHPGFGTGLTYTVPQEETVNGETVHLRFSAVHCPYILPQETRRLTPLFLQSYVGNWQKGVDIYKNWIAENSLHLTQHIAEWAKEPHSWLQYQINSPEDELRMPFKKLPMLAKACKENGITAIQLVGWNEGGQDRGNPLHNPDPRLGTPEDLKNAIAECHALGIKVILFTKFIWADQTADWYRKGGNAYAATNAYGDTYWTDGYFYQTATQQLGISSRPLIPMCFSSKEYRALCKAEFQKVVDLGCDGMLYDECQHHGPALLCFNTAHGHRAGAPVYQNDRKLVQELRTAENLPHDFLVAGEACYDWEATEYAMVYHRSQAPDYLPVARYTRPTWPMMTAVVGFDDRNMINQCLLYRFIVSYEPYHFKGWPADAGKTLSYGKKAQAFREKNRAYIWDATFRGTNGASVTTVDRTPYTTFAVYDVSEHENAVVVVNYSSEPLALTVQGEKQPLTCFCTVEHPEWLPCNGNITIPAQSAMLFASL